MNKVFVIFNNLTLKIINYMLIDSIISAYN